ncbi:MAG: hypothetical protein ACFFD4_00245 [Candidatus Odinarchaeota archaeon]
MAALPVLFDSFDFIAVSYLFQGEISSMALAAVKIFFQCQVDWIAGISVIQERTDWLVENTGR